MNIDQFFSKEDTADDNLFYDVPRIVTHIDDNAITILKGYLKSLLKDGDAVLDLMSSWVSHLPMVFYIGFSAIQIREIL